MKIVDINLLIYAVNRDTPHHSKAKKWLEESLFKELLTPLGTAANLTSDAHLAALTIEHGARLYSTDNDFSRFPSLRWINPIEKSP